MPYKTYVAKINECDAVTPDNFKNSRWANYFTVDSSNIEKNGRANPYHVFDIFGTFSGHTRTEVRVKLLENIASDMPFYQTRSAVCLQMRSIKLEAWVEAITNELVYCDKLGLMGLCYMYHHHCVVLTQNKLWSTVQADRPLNLLDLLNICSVCLIYLGNLRFGVLTWRPSLPKKVATQSPGFNIIKEYTLDDVHAAAGDKMSKVTPEATTHSAVNVKTGDSVKHEPDPKTSDVSTVKVDSDSTLKTDTTCSNIPVTPGSFALEENTSSAISCKDTGIVTESPKHADNVQTQSEESASLLPTEESTLPVVTSSENTLVVSKQDQVSELQINADLSCSPSLSRAVTCPEDSLVLLHYPWK